VAGPLPGPATEIRSTNPGRSAAVKQPEYRTGEIVKEGFRFTGLVVFGGVLALAAVLFLVAMATFGFGFFSQKSADFRGETSKRNQVEANGAFRIAAYDRFFDLCTSVQASEATLTALRQELTTNPPQSRITQINGAITANTANRAATIRQYNNDAAKSYTVGQFQASNLPYQLDINAQETSCAAQ
jgi:hypothetical protein